MPSGRITGKLLIHHYVFGLKATPTNPWPTPSVPHAVEKMVEGEGAGTLLCMGFFIVVIIGISFPILFA